LKRILSGIFLTLMGSGCQTSANPILPTHMLRLECSNGDGTVAMSRAAVLDIGDEKHDFAFTTGHAIPSERPCVVKDFAGAQSAVTLIRLADEYKSGEPTDWAVIKFDKIQTKGLVRYTLDPVEDLDALKEKEFIFARARGISANSQKCSLTILDFSEDYRRVVHDCRAIPGQSGSPITRLVDGEPMLVGLHIGHLWMLESPVTGRPDRKGYINLLDQKTVDEIESVINSYRN